MASAMEPPNTSDLSIVNANNYDSFAKRQLDLWYRDKLMNTLNNNKPVTDYIVDGTWCNDRSITRTNNYNSGYLLSTATFFAPRSRLLDSASSNISATVMCSNVNDRFSTTSTYGNAKLTYPIGLITADEIVFAGGKYNVKNENNWLRTSGLFLTMTPVYYSSDMSNCSEFTMMQDGSLGYTSVTNSAYGLRPVINLKSDTLMSGGDGTPTNPYIIE